MRACLKTFGAGVLGFLIAWSAWHLYLDHQAHHALLQFVHHQLQRQAAPPAP